METEKSIKWLMHGDKRFADRALSMPNIHSPAEDGRPTTSSHDMAREDEGHFAPARDFLLKLNRAVLERGTRPGTDGAQEPLPLEARLKLESRIAILSLPVERRAQPARMRPYAEMPERRPVYPDFEHALVTDTINRGPAPYPTFITVQEAGMNFVNAYYVVGRVLGRTPGELQDGRLPKWGTPATPAMEAAFLERCGEHESQPTKALRAAGVSALPEISHLPRGTATIATGDGCSQSNSMER